jgi:hypothetical protein
MLVLVLVFVFDLMVKRWVVLGLCGLKGFDVFLVSVGGMQYFSFQSW